MKALLRMSAIIEVVAGLVTVIFPSILGEAAFGVSLSTPVELTLARAFGIALLALAVACWFSHRDVQSNAAKGVVGGMVIYNTGIIIVLAYAGISLGLSGFLLWPFILIHLVMAVWCLVYLRKKPELLIEQVK